MARPDYLSDEVLACSIEEAVRLKEGSGAEVKVLLVGPEQAQATVRKALSYGLLALELDLD